MKSDNICVGGVILSNLWEDGHSDDGRKFDFINGFDGMVIFKKFIQLNRCSRILNWYHINKNNE